MRIVTKISSLFAIPSILLLGLLVWTTTLEPPQAPQLLGVYTDAHEVLDVPEEEIVVENEVQVEEEVIVPDTTALVLHNVPFTSQAPTFNWDDIRQQNACEEASALMAIAWARDEVLPNAAAVEEELLRIDAYEDDEYGVHLDTSARDVLSYIIHGYFGYKQATLESVTDVRDIVEALTRGVVIIPTDGQMLGNPHFTAPGPERHMLVVIGYDPESNEFITNDPGTQFGKSYRYDEDVLFASIRDYESGYHVPIEEMRKLMIVVEKE